MEEILRRKSLTVLGQWEPARKQNREKAWATWDNENQLPWNHDGEKRERKASSGQEIKKTREMRERAVGWTFIE